MTRKRLFGMGLIPSIVLSGTIVCAQQTNTQSGTQTNTQGSTQTGTSNPAQNTQNQTGVGAETRGQIGTEQRGQLGTDRGQLGTQGRGQVGTEQRGQLGTDRGQSGTQQRGTGSEQRGQIGTDRGQINTQQRGTLGTEQRGQIGGSQLGTEQGVHSQHEVHSSRSAHAMYAHGGRSSALIGSGIRLASGDVVGRIEDFVIGQTGCVDYLIVSFNRMPDLQNRLAAIPFGIVEMDFGARVAVVDIERESLREAPIFFSRSAGFPNLYDDTWSQTVHQHFNLETSMMERSERVERAYRSPEGAKGEQKKERNRDLKQDAPTPEPRNRAAQPLDSGDQAKPADQKGKAQSEQPKQDQQKDAADKAATEKNADKNKDEANKDEADKNKDDANKDQEKKDNQPKPE